MESEAFIGQIREAGNGSLEITVPANLCKFMGLVSGDTLKVLIQKMPKKEE